MGDHGYDDKSDDCTTFDETPTEDEKLQARFDGVRFTALNDLVYTIRHVEGERYAIHWSTDDDAGHQTYMLDEIARWFDLGEWKVVDPPIFATGGVCAPLMPTFDLSIFDREPMTPEESMALKRRIMEEAAKIKAEEEALAAAKVRVAEWIEYARAHPDVTDGPFTEALALVLDEANKVPDLEERLYDDDRW